MIPLFDLPLSWRNAVALPLRIVILGPLLFPLFLGKFLAETGEMIEQMTDSVGDWISARLMRCDL